MRPRFEEMFRSSLPTRDKFLSRLFGLFSEEVVRAWCACDQAMYVDQGRPYVVGMAERYGHTLDFTLTNGSLGKTYVAELKCELEYEGYRYLRLSDVDQLGHHSGAAFKKLLSLARDPNSYSVRVGGRPLAVDGAILVWGAVSSHGREAVMRKYGFADVLGIENMLDDLHEWNSAAWHSRVDELKKWCIELFDFLR